MRIYTIGFSKKTASQFFNLLIKNGVERVIDVRLNPGGQLAGFTKIDDIPFFLANIAKCDYYHLDVLAPTKDILSEYRSDNNWPRLVDRFETLMEQRQVPNCLDRQLFEDKVCCLLCSEATPEKCHRRLVAERLAKNWPGTEIIHLV